MLPASLPQPCPHARACVRSAGYDDVDTYPRILTNILIHLKASTHAACSGSCPLAPSSPPAAESMPIATLISSFLPLLQLRACRLRPSSAPSSPPAAQSMRHTRRLRLACSRVLPPSACPPVSSHACSRVLPSAHVGTPRRIFTWTPCRHCAAACLFFTRTPWFMQCSLSLSHPSFAHPPGWQAPRDPSWGSRCGA